jgi:hypothetical protein
MLVQRPNDKLLWKIKKIDFQTQCQKWWILAMLFLKKLAIYSQKEIKIVDIECFLRFSIVRIQPKFKKNFKFLYMFQISIQKYRKVFMKIFSYLACSQIWLNLPMDDHHFDYIKTLTEETLISIILRNFFSILRK